MILITGATEELGREIVRQLRAQGVACTAFVHNEARARAILGPDVPLAIGHFGDYATVQAAVQGMEKLLLLTPTHPDQLIHEMQFVDAAGKAKVKQIVKLSAPQGLMTAAWRARDTTAHAHWQVEEKLRNAARGSAAYTILNVNPLLQPFWRRAAHHIAHNGRLSLPLEQAALSLVDVRDVASAAVATLTDPTHRNKTYALTGASPLTMPEMVNLYSQVTGHATTYDPLPASQTAAVLRPEQLAPHSLAHELALFEAYRTGIAAQNSADLPTLLGRAPRSTADYLREQAAVLRPDGFAQPSTPWGKWAAVGSLVLLALLWLTRRKNND